MNAEQLNYTLTARILHWLIAILIMLMFALGWYMVELPKGAERGWFFALHKSTGLSIFGLVLIRVFWRLLHQPPNMPASIPEWKRRLAHFTHVSLYLLMFIQPLSGYISSSFSGYKTKYFGIPLPHWGWKNPPLNELFTEVHVVGSMLILALVLAHVVGAMAHLIVEKDGVFKRMWFFVSKD